MNTTLWLDAANFNELGQWKLDTQFTHEMGSSYLLACHAPGTPVADATTTIVLPQQGRYRVWVRTRNWYYAYAPGQFTLQVDGVSSGAVLGAQMSNDWVWQIAGDFTLSAGEHSLTLHDLTGFFGRCSSIFITDDVEYVSPRPVPEFEKARAKWLGLSLTPVEEGDYDLLVAGAGPGGTATAIMAARMGSRVLMISDRPVLGGNASIEGGIGMDGAQARQPNARSGGIVEEIIRLKSETGLGWGETITRLCCAEPNLTIVYNQHVIDAQTTETEDGTITIEAAITRDTLKGTRHRYTAKMFADCTGDSWLGYYAGAKYRLGREAKWQFEEEFAPEHPDLLTMSGTIMHTIMKDTGAPTPFEKPDFVTKVNEGKAFGRNIEKIGSCWWVESPNVLDDLYDGEITRDEVFRSYLAYFNYLKNLWDEKDRTVNHTFDYINHINKKRESRRLIGDYTLTQNDCMASKDFPDTVGHAGWPIDLHHPKGIYSGEEGPFFSNTHVPEVKIPFRCLYSKNVDNLMMAGRNTSVTHVALGTARLQATIAGLGQAIGIAAHLCLQKGLTPRQLGNQCLAEYRQVLLKYDQYIPGLQNCDSADLARNATVTASSESKTQIYHRNMGIWQETLPLNKQRACFVARLVCKEIPSVWLLLTNHTDMPIPLDLHLREQADPDAYTTTEDLKIVQSIVPPNGEHWVRFDCDLCIEKRYFWMWVDKTEGLSWRSLICPPLDCTRSERDSADQIFPSMRGKAHCIALQEPVALPANAAAENVINGFGRITNDSQYAWVSDETEALPQWIRLQFDTPTTVNSLHITFDTDMTNPTMAGYCYLRNVPELVQDYTVVVETEAGNIVVAEVSENIMRKQVHQFASLQAKSITVQVSKTGDGKTARIFELRAYHEAEAIAALK